ncbi:MAG: hypothetical protein JXR53_06475 [Bacteroidales bacterium]|nr:hypothetical protein [Bacteroidales bacterium]
MKVTLDIFKLLNEGKLTQAESDKLIQLSSEDAPSLAINILVTIGILAVVGGIIAFKLIFLRSLILGILTMSVGLFFVYDDQQWGVLGNTFILIGSLTIAASLIQNYENNMLVFIFIFIFFLIIGGLTQSSLLVVFSALSIVPIIHQGQFQGYAAAFVFNSIAILKILVYAVLGFGAYFLSSKLESKFERLAIIFARTSFVMLNFGFAMGADRGDRFLGVYIPGGFLAFLWAVALIATGYWATRYNDRFILNTTAVFGLMLLHTQWFARLNTQPFVLLFVGVIAIYYCYSFMQKNSQVELLDQSKNTN